MRSTENKVYQPRGAALALVLATERLIAEHGSTGVSLRQITEAAQVANTSATQYHFGSREALMLAVFRYRMRPIDLRRTAYLEALEREGRLGDLRSLVSALIQPLAEELQSRPEGNYYVRFLERRSRENRGESRDTFRELTSAGLRVADLLKETIAYFPEPIVEFRVRLLMEQQSVSGLAAIEASLEKEELSNSDVALRVELLIDACVAMMSGPVSGEALRLLSSPRNCG